MDGTNNPTSSSPNLNEINVRIENLRQLIYCLNVLSRIKSNEKIATPKQNIRPWKLTIQSNAWSLSGLVTRIIRTFSKDPFYTREDNLDYIKLLIEDLRKEFTFLFQYLSKYVVQNNKDAMIHTSLLTFNKPENEDRRSAEDRKPDLNDKTTKRRLNDIKPDKLEKLEEKSRDEKMSRVDWLQMQHFSPLMKKDEKRSFSIQYRLCKCTECLLSYERTLISRIGELLVHALAGMSNAVLGLDFLKDTYVDDDSVIANIQCIQTDLTNMCTQYVNMAIMDDSDPVIKFNREYIDKSAGNDMP